MNVVVFLLLLFFNIGYFDKIKVIIIEILDFCFVFCILNIECIEQGNDHHFRRLVIFKMVGLLFSISSPKNLLYCRSINYPGGLGEFTTRINFCSSYTALR